MIIYLDSDFRCYTDYAEGRQTIETDFFDGKSREYIEGYRYVPDGQTWTRSDGTVFHGLMIAPAKDYNRIMVDVAVSYLDDDEAETVTVLFEEWAVGVSYAVGDRRQYEGLLYRCVQAHTSQADWTPDATPALFSEVAKPNEILPWKQPQGAHNAYNIGDRVYYPDANGTVYESLIDANVWSPADYPQGWKLVE